MIDQEWKNLKDKTNLLDFILDFAQRFPSILFKESDNAFKRLTTKEIVKSIYEQVNYLERELEQDYDSFIDSTVLRSDVGNEIYVGNGQNVILAKTKGKTYRLGETSSGSLIIANKFIGGSGKVIVKAGNKYSMKRVNTVVVGVGSGEAVEIQKLHYNAIITGADQDEIQFYRCGNGNKLICARDSQNRQILILNGGYCAKLIFKKSKEVKMIFKCNDYVNAKTANSPAWPIMVSYGEEKKYKLTLPFKKAETRLEIYAKDANTQVLEIYFKSAEDKKLPAEYWRAPYLVIPTESPVPKEINTKMLVNAIESQFKGSIQFSKEELIAKDEICQFVVNLLKKHPPTKFTLSNTNVECGSEKEKNK